MVEPGICGCKPPFSGLPLHCASSGPRLHDLGCAVIWTAPRLYCPRFFLVSRGFPGGGGYKVRFSWSAGGGIHMWGVHKWGSLEWMKRRRSQRGPEPLRRPSHSGQPAITQRPAGDVAPQRGGPSPAGPSDVGPPLPRRALHHDAQVLRVEPPAGRALWASGVWPVGGRETPARCHDASAAKPCRPLLLVPLSPQPPSLGNTSRSAQLHETSTSLCIHGCFHCIKQPCFPPQMEKAADL